LETISDEPFEAYKVFRQHYLQVNPIIAAAGNLKHEDLLNLFAGRWENSPGVRNVRDIRRIQIPRFWLK